MKAKAKLDEERHRETAQKKLSARIAMLAGKGNETKIVDRDVLVRKLKAEIRQVDLRLRQAAVQDKITSENLQRKKEKAAAEKEAAAAPRKKAAPKSEKKEKKPRVKKEKVSVEE